MNNKPVCWVPYHGVEVHPNGYVSPCCKISFQDNTSPYKFDLSKFYSEEAKQWRAEKFEQGELQDLCRQCKVPDGIFSYRRMNEWSYKETWKFPEPTAENASIRKMILGADNICASSCIECSPRCSTTINNLIEKAGDERTIRFHGELPGLKQVDINQLDNKISDLEVLHFYGGEPLFSPNFIKILEKVKQHSPKLQAITMSTGLCRIKDTHVKALADMNIKFNRVTISLDGPLDLNHWIRDASPEEFMRSFNLLVDQKEKIIIIGAQTTVGIYNVFALPEYYDLFQTLFTKETTNEPTPGITPAVVTAPAELHPRQLPQEIKDSSIKKLQSFLWSDKCTKVSREIMNTAIFAMQQPATIPWDRCLERMELHPKLRGSEQDFNYWLKKYL